MNAPTKTTTSKTLKIQNEINYDLNYAAHLLYHHTPPPDRLLSRVAFLLHHDAQQHQPDHLIWSISVKIH
jgi:hypothetical protein